MDVIILVMAVVAVVKMEVESIMLITRLVIAIKMSKNKSGCGYGGSVNNCGGDGDDWGLCCLWWSMYTSVVHGDGGFFGGGGSCDVFLVVVVGAVVTTMAGDRGRERGSKRRVWG